MSEETKPFCVLPFLSLTTDPFGSVSPCCWNQNYRLGDAQKESLLDIWNNEKMQSLREEFLSGNIQSCATQIRHMKCHQFFKGLLPMVDKSVVQKKGPRKLDLRLNGKCNLECQMCTVWKQPNGTYEESDLWTRGPKEIFPYLIEVDILGGEPFVQKDTYRLIREVSQANPKCRWAFVTNGHWAFSQAVRKHLDMVIIRWVQLSIDSLDPANYAAIRKKGQLHVCLKNLDDWIEYRKDINYVPFSITISVCVQRDNWHEIPEFVEFAYEKDIFLSLQYTYDPDWHSLTPLPEEERRRIYEFLARIPNDPPRINMDPVLIPLRETFTKSKEPLPDSKPSTLHL